MKYKIYLVILSILITSCQNPFEQIVLPDPTMTVVDNFKKELDAKDIVIKRALDDNKIEIENSVEIVLQNCENIKLSDDRIEILQDSIATEVILSYKSYDNLPSYIRVTFFEGYNYYLVSQSHQISQSFKDNYIQARFFNQNQINQRIEQRIKKLLNENRINEAMSYCDSVIISNVNTEIALQYRGYIYYLNADTVKAIQDFKNAIKVNPHNQINFWNLSLIYGEQKDYKAARECMDNYLTIIPDDPRATYYKGYYLYMLGNRSEGCEEIQHAKLLGFKKDAETPVVDCK